MCKIQSTYYWENKICRAQIMRSKVSIYVIVEHNEAARTIAGMQYTIVIVDDYSCIIQPLRLTIWKETMHAILFCGAYNWIKTL
jgi:hypothetical protein